MSDVRTLIVHGPRDKYCHSHYHAEPVNNLKDYTNSLLTEQNEHWIHIRIFSLLSFSKETYILYSISNIYNSFQQ